MRLHSGPLSKCISQLVHSNTASIFCVADNVSSVCQFSFAMLECLHLNLIRPAAVAVAKNGSYRYLDSIANCESIAGLHCRVDISDTLMYVYEMLGAELLSNLYDRLGRQLMDPQQSAVWQVM